MPNAQDEAFVVLARRRGVLAPEQLRAAHDLRPDVGVEEPLAQLLLKGKVLAPALVASLLRDLARGHFACERCAERVGYDHLSRLALLSCPRCGGQLGFIDPSGSDLGPQDRVPARPTGNFPAVSGGTGVHAAVGAGVHPAAPHGTGAFAAAHASGAYPPPASGAYPQPASGAYPPTASGAYPPPSSGAFPPPSSGAFPPPSSGAYPPSAAGGFPGAGAGPRATGRLSAAHAAVAPPAEPAAVPPPEAWDAEATVLDRKRRAGTSRFAPGAAAAPTSQGPGPSPQMSPADRGRGAPGPAAPDAAESTVRDGKVIDVSTTRDPRVISLPGGGKTIGPYVLVSELGRGTGSIIFLARRPGLERRFAVKVLQGEGPTDEAAVKRFQREAALASKIDDPGIVAVFDTGCDAGRYYYAMEYCPGPTLEARLSAGPLAPAEAARLVLALARTVQAAHDKGVIHRDLKPANVILEETTGRPRVTDFGVARDVQLGRTISRAGEVLGTPAYMAPEQLLGERTIDARVDVYALGVILFECLTGKRPHAAPTTVLLAEQVCHQDAPPLRSLIAEAPAALETVCRRALARDRAARYSSARSLARDLERFLAGRGVAGRGARTPGALALPLLVGGAAVALAAAGVAIGWSGARGGSAAVDQDELRRQVEAQKARAAALSKRLSELRDELHARKTPLAKARAEVAALTAGPDAPEEARALAAALDAIAAARAGDRPDSAQVMTPLEAAIASTHADTRLLAELHLAAAEHLRRRARLEEALTHAELALAERGRLGLEARLLRALTLRQLERHPESDEPLQALEQADPQGALGVLARAARLSLTDLEAAVTLARRARELDPDLPWARLRLISALFNVRRPADAVEEADAYLALAPDDQVGHMLRGLALADLRRAEEALAAFDRAVALGEPAPDPIALRARGEHLSTMRQPAKAIDDLDRALRARPDPKALILRGRLHDDVGRTTAAEADWRQAHALDAARVEQLVRALPSQRERRRIRQALGQPDYESDAPGLRTGELTAELQESIARRAGRAPEGPAREALRDALLRAARGQELKEVVARLDAATRAAAGSVEVAVERAILLTCRDAYPRALEAIARARELAGPALLLDRLEAEVYLREGKLTEAEQRYQALAKRDPSGAEGYCAQAEVQRLVGQAGAALELIDAALGADAEHVGALALKGELLLDLEPPDYKGALEAATRALAVVGACDTRPLLVRLRCMGPVVVREVQENREDGRVFDAGTRARGDTIMREFGTLLAMSDSAAVPIAGARMCLDTRLGFLAPWAAQMLTDARTREPDRADLSVVIGRFELLVNNASPERVLSHWQRARGAEPLTRIPEQFLREFRRVHGDRPDLAPLATPPGGDR